MFSCIYVGCLIVLLFFFQAEDGIRDLVRSRGLGDVYKRQRESKVYDATKLMTTYSISGVPVVDDEGKLVGIVTCLLYTSDAADERSSVDLGGRRIIKKKKNDETGVLCYNNSK